MISEENIGFVLASIFFLVLASCEDSDYISVCELQCNHHNNYSITSCEKVPTHNLCNCIGIKYYFNSTTNQMEQIEFPYVSNQTEICYYI